MYIFPHRASVAIHHIMPKN